MPKFLIRVLAAGAGFWIASRIIPGVHVGGVGALLLAALMLGVINAVVRPIIVLLTLPITVLTLGLFLLVVNGFTVWLVTRFMPGVHVHGFWDAMLTALVISMVSWIAGALLEDRNRR